jgi:glycosyltransferase involved in cell wall biosynthesis
LFWSYVNGSCARISYSGFPNSGGALTTKSLDDKTMNNKSAPLISIIIAVYNGAKTLQQCIDSVAQQSYPNKELIIIDGGSRDGTVGLLEANNNQINYWISEPDRGIYNAWNKGLAQATGEWICFLGADDFFWESEALARMGVALKNVPPEVRLAYSRIMLFTVDGKQLFPVGESWEKMKTLFNQGMCLPHQGVIHRRSLFEQNGNFDESFRIGGDYELMLRELKSAEAKFIPDIIAVAMRQGGLSSNPSSTVEAMRDIRRAQKMHGQNWPTLFWLSAMVRVYIRMLLWKLFGENVTRKLLDMARRIKGVPPYWTET